MSQQQAGSAQRQQAGRAQHHERKRLQEVVVADVDISFGNMVMLLIKLAFASIPAAIIIWVVMLVFGLIAASVLGVGGAMLGAAG
ncbi:hypothetical protein FIV42_15650 [Persicimonas caeni]|uniref:Uncharacterized protein n=1 Tax=Persicimonas caeni TaxID=2292766 RepID=A0A4Y6PUV4_PERCE|nr:hypothetical protein [Persicimonas caeni]QDG52124.1 hypothetical protein FIV42_15650 [Persicimonas caeni]QED33346.1 hypothetical protein FRD00_15645 [Persicimonas caeni]